MMPNKTKKNGDSYPSTIFWIVIMGLFLTEMLFYTWCRIQCTKTGYAIARENKKNYDFLSLQKNLEIELTQLKSPNRIAQIAKKQLGLDIPKPEQIKSLP
ncbi:MAG: cell division protein FtsL [Desulfobacteraceae bacterium]|jgi:cell division protein FtsL